HIIVFFSINTKRFTPDATNRAVFCALSFNNLVLPNKPNTPKLEAQIEVASEEANEERTFNAN
ncbi:MAG: hypothetical protein AAGL09_18115, partial [Pseudomonadota bacterium]